MADSILSMYYGKLKKAQTEYATAKENASNYRLNTFNDIYNWYMHLYNMQAWNNHPVEWAAARPNYEDNAKPTMDRLDSIVASKLAEVKQAEKDYENAKDTLVSPAEIVAHESQIQAETELAEKTAQSKLSLEEQAAFRKKIINYIVLGVIIILVIAGSIWAYKKFIKKKAA